MPLSIKCRQLSLSCFPREHILFSHLIIMSLFDVQYSTKYPLHLCGNNCPLRCKFKLVESWRLCYSVASPQRNRMVVFWTKFSDWMWTKKISKPFVHQSLCEEACGKLKVFGHTTILFRFSNVQISQVIDPCSKLFTPTGTCNCVGIWYF